MDLINDHNWEELGKQFRAADPFPSICIDNFLRPEFADDLEQSFPDYNSANEVGREIRSLNSKHKTQIDDPDLFPEPVAAVGKALGSQVFLDGLGQMSGIPNLHWDPFFRGGGMHLTGKRGNLDVHVDFNFDKKLGLYRRLNILIYLNPVWEESWGGRVEFWDKNIKNCVQSFMPIHNRCVIFETSDYSFHGVTAVTCPEDVTRNSIAAYFYSDEAGENDGQVWGGNHSTIFKARPNEVLKKYWLMPWEKFVKKNIKTYRGSDKN